jgi:ABC-type nickel/cobalt efflux system permease component RcnA
VSTSRAVLAVSAAIIALCSSSFWPAGSADAHPLGNFTVNHYTRLDVSATGIEVYRVLDMAEIPALQERQRIDVNEDGIVDDAEAAAYVTSAATAIGDALSLVVDGERRALTPASTNLSFPEGQGGLSLLRLEISFRADLPENWRDAPLLVAFSDANDLDRIGWREVIVRGGPGVELESSSVPAVDVSNELTAYPDESLSSPLDVRTASFSFASGSGAPFAGTDPRRAEAVRGNPDGALAGFADLLVKDDLSAGVIAAALVAALAFGAYHALTPGHGKTVVAAYLIGSRGTARHALLLGLVVTATHTSSVYIVGFVALYLSQYILPEDLYPWLGLVSGGLILAMGVSLLASRLRSTGIARACLTYVLAWMPRFGAPRPAMALATEAASVSAVRLREHGSAHEHSGDLHNHRFSSHDHAHEHAVTESDPHRHGFGPAHSHGIPGLGGEPVTLRSLIGLGIFGGMIPCPSAIVVMLGAIALHRVAFGLLLIVAFSLGLATVLVTIGFALVYANAIKERVPMLRALEARASGCGVTGVALRLLPVVSAAAVVVAGLVITLRALTQQGAL